jgi:hypothetical protein
VEESSGRNAALLRQAHSLRQVDVARAMILPVSRRWVHQLKRCKRLSAKQFQRLGAAIRRADR